MRLAFFLALSVASPALSETLMTPEQFDAWSTGQTLDYFLDGTYWGSEAHFSGRATTDETDSVCREGRWFPQDGAVCFEYGPDGPFCWYFWRDGDTVTTRTTDAGADDPTYEVTLSDNPLNCPGPDVGV